MIGVARKTDVKAGRKGWLGWVLLLIAAPAALGFVYRGLLTEDAAFYALGVIELAEKGLGELPQLFNGEMSFGYYLLQWGLFQIHRSVGQVSVFANYTNAVASIALIAVAYALVRRWFDEVTAFFAGLLLLLAPGYWQLSHYGHPLLPAMALFMGSLLALDKMLADPQGMRRASVDALAFVLLAAATLAMRGDMLLLFGACFGLLVFRRGGEWPGAARLAGLIALAGLLFELLRIVFLGYAINPTGGTVVYHLGALLRPDVVGQSILKNLALWAFGVNGLVGLCAAAGLGMAAARRNYRLLALALPWLVPLVVFLPFHALDFSRISTMSTPMVAVLAASLPGALAPRQRWIGGAALILASQLVAVSMYPVATRIYSFATAYQGRWVAAVPLGFNLEDSRVKQEYLTARDRIAQEVTAIRDRDVVIIGYSSLMPYRFFLRTQRDAPHKEWTRVGGVLVSHVDAGDNSFYLFDADGCAGCVAPVSALLTASYPRPTAFHVVPFDRRLGSDGLFLTEAEIQQILQAGR